MIGGRYTLGREIGRGGSGTVHLAHDEVLGREVAIKRIGIMPGAHEAEVARAEREARIAAGLNHANVVSVFDLVEEDHVHWLVMEYVDGQTLSQLVASSGPLDSVHAASLIGQAADALAEAHAAGIVHRDVKPSNILVAQGSVAKLTDFGIARADSDPSLTQTGLVTGSPAYLAPEVASGSISTTASDVWSLGATLYHALAGRPPYDVGDNVIGALYKIVHEHPPRLPPEEPLAGLLEVMMVQDPEKRWTMDQVRDELRRIARGEPPTVRPAPAAVAPQDPRSTSVLPSVPGGRTRATASARAVRAPSPADGNGSGGRGFLLVLIGGFVALLLVAVLTIWLWPGDGQRPAAGTQDTPSQSPSPTSGAETSAALAGEMESFISDYLATVTSDPRAAFDMLTPQFQAASGGLGGYLGWWRTVESAQPSGFEADADNLLIGYTVDYVMRNGSERTEQVRLQLTRGDDGFLIAGEG